MLLRSSTQRVTTDLHTVCTGEFHELTGVVGAHSNGAALDTTGSVSTPRCLRGMSGDTGAGPSACVGGATPGTGPAWGAAWGAADRLLLAVLRGEGVHQHEATIPEQHVATSEPRAALVHVHASARRHGDRQERPTASYRAARVQGLPELRRVHVQSPPTTRRSR